MIRLLIVEDQALVLGALAALMEIESDISVVGQACDGVEGLRLATETQPDVVVTDVEMPRMTGLELAKALRELGPKPRVIILTTFGRAGYLRRALEAGAAGYLLKDSPADELAEAVRRVHNGGRAIDPELATEAWSEPDPLTDRERQVLRLAGDGKPTAAIAEELHLSEGTVRNYLSESITKLDAANRVDAARIARNKGFL
ncbi:MAG: response regulator transcription factor [Thermoanaerobaculia bacterium]|nr:response regulator transcription factor [Thermoanaerobaculia bacterium]